MRIGMPFSKKPRRVEETRTATPATKEPATVEEAIRIFTNSSFPSKWPNINKEDLLNDIKRTIADPYQINQNRTPFCGPASITFELVSRQPIQYVKFLKQIFEKGQFKTKTGKVIKAGRKLLSSNKPDEITVADWMFIGTLRDARNLFVSVKSKGGADNPSGIAGMTGVPAMKRWTKHILGFNKARYKSAIVFGDLKTLKKADKERKSGGVVFPLIHAGLIDESKRPQWSGPQFPNHWVVYLGNLEIKKKNRADSVQFDVYSWGERYHVKTSKSTFRQFYVGAVIGKR